MSNGESVIKVMYMSKRLDQERQKELEPQRMDYAEEKLGELGIACIRLTNGELEFEWQGKAIKLFAYSGWWSGPVIGSGRGINQLVQKLKTTPKGKPKSENKLVRCSC